MVRMRRYIEIYKEFPAAFIGIDNIQSALKNLHVYVICSASLLKFTKSSFLKKMLNLSATEDFLHILQERTIGQDLLFFKAGYQPLHSNLVSKVYESTLGQSNITLLGDFPVSFSFILSGRVQYLLSFHLLSNIEHKDGTTPLLQDLNHDWS